MTNFSDSSAPGTPSDQRAKSTQAQVEFQAGLSALKRKDYPAAIDHLETVCQTATNMAVLSKAQMGLVKAYAQTGGVNAATALCRSLLSNPNPQVSTWASRTLQELSRRSGSASPQTHASAPGLETPEITQDGSASESPPDGTGFIPFHGSSARSSPINSPAHDPTGFTPLNRASIDRSPPKPQQAQAQENPVEDEEKIDLSAYLEMNSAEVASAAVAPSLNDSDEGEEDEAEDLAAYRSEEHWRDTHRVDTHQSDSALADVPEVHLPANSSQSSQPVDSMNLEGRLAIDGEIPWRQAGRAQRWGSLGKVDLSKLWGLQLLTGVLLIGFVTALLQIIRGVLNGILWFLSWIPFLRSIRFYHDPFWFVVITLGILFIAAPWLLHSILQRVYHLKPLSFDQLGTLSPETMRLIKRVCNQRRRPVPQFGIVPTTAPLIFTYGYLPQYTRIVISQGMLDRLQDDELATLYAAELSHITHYATGILTWATLVMQLPYWIYWSVATWSNRQRDRVLQSVGVLVSSIAYGIYWVCRIPGLWLSRVRPYYGDRASTELTGNPNGLTRALLKTAIGMAQDIQQQTYTHPLLESLDLLLPIGPKLALTLGSVYLHHPTADLLEWDRSHPHRRWLTLNNSHPPLGDRLNLLTMYAQHWRLDSELAWQQNPSTYSPTHPPTHPSTPLLLQGSPYFGALFGLLVAAGLWLVGWIAYVYRWSLLDWIWLDRQVILLSCLLLGFGVGLLMRINPAYPDTKRLPTTNLDLVDLLSHPNAMPIDKTPVRIQGQLLGRPRFLNRLYQDLMLQTPTGLIRLHYTSRISFLGNVLSQSPRPTDLLNPTNPNHTNKHANCPPSSPPVTVTGWFRRGATPWLEVDTIQTQRRTTFQSGHPTWSAIVAIGSALLGIYFLVRG